MKPTRGWTWFGGALLMLLAASCSSASDLSKVCIPQVDCAAINSIETPANCTACSDCQDNWGACVPGGAACKRGSLDLDARVAGCEALASDAKGQWVMHSLGEAVTAFSFNGDPFELQMSVPVIAYDKDDPNCLPTASKSCAYTFHALQLAIPDFEIPESTWKGGVATLTGPVVALDQASGAGALASMAFAFDVQQHSQRRVALASAVVSIVVTPDADPHRASVTIQAELVDFGGYKIQNLYLNGELSSD